ncbi:MULTISPECIES: CobW family GTP-binding protein [Paraburkholderia]|uniref:CobW family GTP-binding protein n=1 Tax=Paraburkholderia TaxID=1822464 RepID=UPI0038BAA7D3
MIERIPIYLLTGFLGSGKTTLLKSWLQQPLMRNSALIVNEIGAVGLDHATLGYASDASALLADACVCCTGLPGLHEALENLFWARLHRSVPRFDAVVVETTGLADPAPLIASLQTQPFVSERYCLAGVVTTLGAPTALQTMAEFAEARRQLDAAGVIVVTKTDLLGLVELDTIGQALQRSNPATRVLRSTHGSLSAEEAWHAARTASPPERPDSPSSTPMRRSWRAVDLHGTGSRFVGRGRPVHGASTRFEALPPAADIDSLRRSLDRLILQHCAALLRMKGIVRLVNGATLIVQFTRGDREAQLSVASEATRADTKNMPGGVTLIFRLCR